MYHTSLLFLLFNAYFVNKLSIGKCLPSPVKSPKHLQNSDQDLCIFHLVSSFFFLLADKLLSLLITGSFMHLFIKYTYTEESRQPGQEI